MDRSAEPDRKRVIYVPRGTQVDATVAGDQHSEFTTESTQRSGQRTHDIGKPACFCEGRGLGGNHQNFDHRRGILIMTERASLEAAEPSCGTAFHVVTTTL